MAIKSLSLSLALVAVVALPVAAKAASDCPGDEMTAVPYADSGGFPTGLDDLNPIGLDLTACGAPGPIGQNGPDFVVTIPVGAQTAMLDCTLTSTGPALVVWGLAEPCGYPGAAVRGPRTSAPSSTPERP